MKSRLLILGAFAPEVEPIERGLKSSPSGVVSCHTVGVGIAEAAAQTARLLGRFEAGATVSVLFIGTAGKIAPLPASQSFVNVSEACLIDFAKTDGKAFLPENFQHVLSADQEIARKISAAMQKSGRPLAEGKVYSSPSITSNDEVAARYAAVTGANHENLELFGIASACRLFGVSWNAVCPVSNAIGAEGHRQWLENHQACAGNIADLLFEVILPQVYLPAGGAS